MKVLAICAQSYAQSVQKAAGVDPICSPPMTLTLFDPAMLQGYDFIYIKLHGFPHQPFWYGDRYITTCSLEQLAQADLGGAVVFLANCHSFQNDPDGTPRLGRMLKATLDAGARAVVAGPGENLARAHTVAGADRLGRAFRRWMAVPGIRPAHAFTCAFASIHLAIYANAAERDTRDFRIFQAHLDYRDWLTTKPLPNLTGGQHD